MRASRWHDTALAPFRTRIFLAVWLASLVSNLGSLVQSVGASWLMVSLTKSSDIVALVQAASALPVMLLAMPAGAIADIWDRRVVMLISQGFMVAIAAILAAVAYFGAITPWTLLGLTFLLGCGTALYAPAWQTSVTDFAPREQLAAAVALNSVGLNIARTAGPALGGAIVASAGAPAAFLFNVLSYVALITVLARWRRPVVRHPLPPEGVGAAMAAGLRYVRLSPLLTTTLLRSLVFGLLGSALWALLPLVARDLVGGGALTYGFLLGAFGVGAVLGALGSTQLRARRTTEWIVSAGSASFGVATLVVAASPWLVLTLPALVLAGAAWVLTLSTFNITMQISAPRWVVGRAVAIYQMAAFGGIALGSWIWGLWAEHASLVSSLAVAGVLLLASVGLQRWRSLRPHAEQKLDPMRGPADLRHYPHVPPQAGPVVITVEYRVDPRDHDDFVVAMHEIGRIRRRDGARRAPVHPDR
jgi:MFS family permease